MTIVRTMPEARLADQDAKLAQIGKVLEQKPVKVSLPKAPWE